MKNVIKIRILLIAIFITFFHWTYSQSQKLQIHSDSIVYLNEVSSLDSLLCMFRGHVIYVDFWASWCKPCITELAEQPELETYFQSHGIVRLYIAIEQLQNDLSEMTPDKRVSYIIKLSEFILPKLQSLSLDTQIDLEYKSLEALLAKAPDEVIERLTQKILTLKSLSNESD